MATRPAGTVTFTDLEASTRLWEERTELIGRSDDVRDLAALVGRERLVTLTGVGRVGKTRLDELEALLAAPETSAA